MNHVSIVLPFFFVEVSEKLFYFLELGAYVLSAISVVGMLRCFGSQEDANAVRRNHFYSVILYSTASFFQMAITRAVQVWKADLSHYGWLVYLVGVGVGAGIQIAGSWILLRYKKVVVEPGMSYFVYAFNLFLAVIF